MSYPVLPLVPGKEAAAGFWHPWIFSGAIASRPKPLEHGDLVHVADRQGKIIGTGTFSSKSSIAVRVFEFCEATIDKDWFVAKLKAAVERRAVTVAKDTTAYRVVFGEADGIPGLVVDKFDGAFAFQISTMGLDRMRDDIVAALDEAFAPRVIVERSDVAVRREEGLNDFVAVHKGDIDAPVAFAENGLSFVADVQAGQKTGFFLDQKDLRKWLLDHGARGSVLNLFSYSGAAGIAAVKAGAERVHNVDGSVEALDLCKAHAERNDVSADRFTTEVCDAFDWLNLNKDSRYDAVIMDPPALIKAGRDAEEGKKAYHFLNRAAMRLVNDGGLFVTSSCSHFLSEDDLAFILRRASVQAGVRLDVLAVVRQSADHPRSVYFPESAYLKSFVCRVSRVK
jgi:23S rRNA (cytosine1962-C5)-methyltransferase